LSYKYRVEIDEIGKSDGEPLSNTLLPFDRDILYGIF